jgi:hypothetical protein
MLAMSKFAIQELSKTVSKWRNWPACANPSCKGNALKQAVGKRHFGVSVADDWFCSPECFEQGARKKIWELFSARHHQEKTAALRMPLGLLLVSRGVLTEEQLKVSLERQRASGGNIGEIVQELGFATEQHVTAAVAAQWGCPVFALEDRRPPNQVRIPRRLLEHYGMLPVHYSDIGRRLMVGFVTRVQHHVLYTIEQITACKATPCFVAASDYRRGLHAFNSTSPENEIVFDRANSTLEIIRMIRSYVNQSGAAQARFGMCRDYLWVRVIGRHEIDLLFRLEEG